MIVMSKTLTTAGQYKRLGGVSCYGPHIVRVGVECVLSLKCIVIEHANLGFEHI